MMQKTFNKNDTKHTCSLVKQQCVHDLAKWLSFCSTKNVVQQFSYWAITAVEFPYI